MKTYLICVCVCLAVCSDFSQYCLMYNKTYPDSQKPLRQRLFLQRLTQIDFINVQNLGYTLGINNFTDWTDQELKHYNNATYDPNAPVSELDREPGKVGFPSSKDWRSEGKVTSVKQQGSCGACWAFSATAVYESLLMMKVNRTEDLSEEYVLECSGANSNCGGGYVQDAYNLMINTGIPTETAFPYLGTRSGSVTPSTPGICSSTNFVTLPSKTTSKQYRNLTNENLRNLVATAPVVVLIYADLGFTSYKSGIYGCSKANVTKDDLNHAVVIVGYDDTKFIVKNSYGKDWGQEGYMDLNISNNCGINLYVYELSNDYEPPAPAPAPTPDPAPAPTPIQATPESPKSAIRLLSLLAVVLFSLLIVN